MGKTIVKIGLTNYDDLVLQGKGLLRGVLRQAEVEALVDTGVTGLYLKPSVIQALGLSYLQTVSSRTAAGGRVELRQYSPVLLEILGRTESFNVREVPEDVPNLVGQVPLEILDFVVDPGSQQLIGNPEHGGVRMTDVYRVACASE